MNVAQLIAALQELPQDARVVTWGSTDTYEGYLDVVAPRVVSDDGEQVVSVG